MFSESSRCWCSGALRQRRHLFLKGSRKMRGNRVYFGAERSRRNPITIMSPPWLVKTLTLKMAQMLIYFYHKSLRLLWVRCWFLGFSRPRCKRWECASGEQSGQPRAERFGAKVTQKHILSSKASEPFFFFFHNHSCSILNLCSGKINNILVTKWLRIPQ